MFMENEPMAYQKFQPCLWSGENMRVFIRDYLGRQACAGESFLCDSESVQMCRMKCYCPKRPGEWGRKKLDVKYVGMVEFVCFGQLW